VLHDGYTLVPDYGCGNLGSVLRMGEKAGHHIKIVHDPTELRDANRIILAGVGAFDHGVQCLRETGWTDALNDAVLQRHVPVLGICLGMQLMCKSSEEGNYNGLGWIDAMVRRFKPPSRSSIKVPHMGWNTLTIKKQNPLMSDAEGELRFYFVHSFHVICNVADDVFATAYHGYDFVAGFERGNIFGVQFHPEKSHRFGLSLMKKFTEL
jgi:imidazole glycerol-phosphate synthase subunit HisH